MRTDPGGRTLLRRRVSTGRVDIAASLSPFVAVYDQSGRLLATDGELDGPEPHPPTGVIETARSQGIDRVTWQPRPSVRMALVAVPWTGGTILADRSLIRAEDEVDAIGRIVALGWLGAVGALTLASLVSAWLWPRAQARSTRRERGTARTRRMVRP